MLTLTIATHDFYVAAIKNTFKYIDQPCTYVLGDELRLIVENEDETITLEGFLPIFIYCSRKAHTFPQDALEAAICFKSLQVAEYESFEVINEILENKTWFDDRYEMSTCVDFFLISRLLYANQEHDFNSFSNIQKYLQLDPCKIYEKEEQTPNVTNGYCIIS